jgi:bromodomain-containing protein 8
VEEPDPGPSPPTPTEEAPADDEPEKEDAHEAVASEKDEAETGIQTRRGPSPPVVTVTPSRLPKQRSYFTGKRKADAEADPRREKKKSREISEPLEESEPEPGEDVPELLVNHFCYTHSSPAPTKKRRGTTSEAASRIFQNVISLLHDQICQLRNGSIFHGPVKVSDAPDYYDIVRRPIDLKAIKTKIRDGQITNSLEYQRDIYLMFANSMMYNRPDSDLYKMAEEVPRTFLPVIPVYISLSQMMLESEQLINQFRQTEGWNQ